jgi:hypothetical protein
VRPQHHRVKEPRIGPGADMRGHWRLDKRSLIFQRTTDHMPQTFRLLEAMWHILNPGTPDSPFMVLDGKIFRGRYTCFEY